MQESKNQSKRSAAARFVLVLILLLVALGCALGFLATFEPGDSGVVWTFRLLYAGVGLAAGFIVLRLVLGVRHKN